MVSKSHSRQQELSPTGCVFSFNVKLIANEENYMPRDIPVGNGSMLVTFDREYQIRDIYYPYVGKENHTIGHPSRMGVWVDGQFSWMGGEWQKTLKYKEDTLVTDVKARR